MPEPQERLPVRHAARVLLVDPGDRVLLFRSHPGAEGRAHWFSVGGEVEPEETAEVAAVREACEETGLTGLSLGPEIFRRRFVLRWRDTVWDARERWWLARVAYFDPVFDGMEAGEEEVISDWGWMSLADLRAVHGAGDILNPSNLLELLPPLLAGEIPAEPIDLGI